jgi:conjugal transfer pilus assembly protein TraB
MAGFSSLEPEQKKKIIWAVVAIALFAIIMVGYNMRSTRTVRLGDDSTGKQVELEPDLIAKTMLHEQRREMKLLKEEMAEIKRDQAAGRSTGGNNSTNVSSGKTVIPSPDEIANTRTPDAGKEEKWPLPLSTGSMVQQRGGGSPPPPAWTAGSINPESMMIGEIAMVTNPKAEEVLEDPKKKERTVYLPPSFMEANLLTGFDASTSGNGSGSTEPMLLRIQTPAVLPNDIKGNVEGCFVVAEAVGRLDKERADVRLTSLSCLSKNGQAVIDETVKGFVTDSDSKVGLSGRVVSKMGAVTARAVVAGIFGGTGDWLKAASTTTSTSALGTTQTVGNGDIVPYALGGGLSEGSETLEDFYLDLAKQTTPVIEVGAAKKITVIISEGKDLKIREIDSGTI